MMIYLRCLLLFTTLACLSCQPREKYPYTSSGFRPELRKHLQILESRQSINAFEDTEEEKYIRDSATHQELVQLTDGAAPLLRVVAFDALAYRNDSALFDCLLAHLSDTTLYTWWADDTSGERWVADHAVDRALPRLTAVQKYRLADLLVKQYPYLQNTYALLEYLPPRPDWYGAVRRLTLQPTDRCNQERALLALSRYQRPEDRVLFRQAFAREGQHCWFLLWQSIRHYPDPSFFPLLQTWFEQTHCTRQRHIDFIDSKALSDYCQALAAYRSPQSLLLLTALTQPENYPDTKALTTGREVVFGALHPQPCPLYAPLYQQLKPYLDEYAWKHPDQYSRWRYNRQWDIW